MYLMQAQTFEIPKEIEQKHYMEEQKVNRETDWLALFPEAREYVHELIRQRRENVKELGEHYKRFCQEIKSENTNELSKYFWIQLVKHSIVTQIVDINRHITRLEKDLSKGKQSRQTYHSSVNLERAKECQIVDIASEFTDFMRTSGKYTVIRCPFHQPDRHPSCIIYHSSNSFYCFSCGAHGDVVSFAEQVLGCSFKEAVVWLCERSA